MFQVHAQRIHAISEGQCGVPGTVAGTPVGTFMQARVAPAALVIMGVQGCAQVVMLAADIGQQD